MYAPTPPHDEGLLDVGDGQRLHYEVRGDPDGVPAVVLHGGPGSGASPRWAGFFDPERYRVVLLDQRGAGRSTPSTQDPATDLSVNATAHLVEDLERLRTHLGVERWLLLGGSWGSTLGLTYAVTHPEHVRAVVLGAVTLTRTVDVEWLTRGVGRYFPEAHERFVAGLPEPDRDGNLAPAYARRLASPDPQARFDAATAWCEWEEAIASLESAAVPGVWSNPRYADPAFRYGFARTVTHYLRERRLPARRRDPEPAASSSPASLRCSATGGSTWPGRRTWRGPSREAGRAPGCTSSTVSATSGRSA